MSVKISEESFSIITLAKAGIAFLILLKGGPGLPLQRLERVQLALRMKLEPAGILRRRLAIGSTAPLSMIIFLMQELSPARLPRHQIACSTTVRC